MRNLSQATKIVLIVAIVVLVLGVLAIAWQSGEDIGDLLTGAGAWLGGVVSTLLARWFLKTGTVPTSALLLLLAPMLWSCPGYVPPSHACRVEGSIVAGLDAGLDAAAGVIGDSAGEDWDELLGAARSSVDLGGAAIEACENQRDRAGWQEWVRTALSAASAVASFIDVLAGPEDVSVPPELDRAIAELEAEQERVYSPDYIDQ